LRRGGIYRGRQANCAFKDAVALLTDEEASALVALLSLFASLGMNAEDISVHGDVDIVGRCSGKSGLDGERVSTILNVDG
jgi:hypothetical protein